MDVSQDRVSEWYHHDTPGPDQPRQCIGIIWWGAHHSKYGEGDKAHTSSRTMRERWLRDSSASLFQAAKGLFESSKNHFECLDQVFSTLMICEFRPTNSRAEDVVDYAWKLLQRLSSTSTPLPDDLSLFHERFFKDHQRQWQTLSVNSSSSSNLVRLALLEAYCAVDSHGRHDIDAIISSTGQLIATCVANASDTNVSPQDKVAWFLIRAYLWHFWQQLRTMHQALFVMREIDLIGGFSHGNESVLWLRDFSIANNVSLRQHTRSQAVIDKADNLCSWAFELVRNNNFCLGLDFRLLHDRWQSTLGPFDSRCSQTCDGSHPHRCVRYKGLEVQSQSMHDSSCSGSDCVRLPWDASSYIKINGARAVSVFNGGKGTKLQYCEASSSTMAISHVWSHGQGGRPETGINQCLHHRYSTIARKHDCDSYWMDVTCIPDEHNLRKEAIDNINTVFGQSKGVLVCDLDLMKIEVDPDQPCIDKDEAILCTILLSDWNLRAWTLLEGLKGRRNILILCKGNEIISLPDIVRRVAHAGNLNMIAFAYLIGHMLPRPTVYDLRPDDERSSIAPSIIGAWLSHRPASRPGDDIVIWSLSLNRNAGPLIGAKEFWRSQKIIHAGYLLSSAERLTERGLTWAPKTPYAIPELGKDGTVPEYHLPFLGPGTEPLWIDEDGLSGNWWVYEFPLSSDRFRMRMFGGGKMGQDTSTEKELQKVASRFLTSPLAKYGALLKTVATEDVEDIAMVSAEGTLVAVCESNGWTVRSHRRVKTLESYRWTWKGVYRWPADVPLPKFEWDSFLWIS